MFKALSTIAVISMLVAGGDAMPTERRVKAAAAKLHHVAHVSADTAAAVNAKTNGQWVASEKQGTLISGASREDLKRLMGVKPKVGGKTKSLLKRKTFPKGAVIPDSFDAATQWPDCPTITHIRDQSACGSCWAVAAAESLSDRYCTFGGPKNLEISAANLMECCWWCGSGCEGGQPADAWAFWTTNGIVSDECQPYPFPKCSHHVTGGKYPECPSTTYSTPSCQSTCTNNSTAAPVYYKGKTSYTLQGEADFQQELMTNGPFEVAFSVYADFPLYKGGVYVQTSQDYLGGHAVRVVGWGTLDGVKYWKIANSWNSGWGLDGYFLIKRGVDECGIEDEGAAGQPLL